MHARMHVTGIIMHACMLPTGIIYMLSHTVKYVYSALYGCTLHGALSIIIVQVQGSNHARTNSISSYL